MEYGCIAQKLSHSFSKTIHNMLESYDYQLCELEPDSLAGFFEKREFKGINVTIPYKQDVIKYLDYTDSIALEIGAVNTIVNREGRLYGYNTDFEGMRALIKKLGIAVEGKKVAVLGSGGTSKTANAVAKSLGAQKILRVSRTEKDGCISYDTLYKAHSDTDVIINTTPCGMYPDIFGAAAEIDRFEKLSGVVDAVYNPLRSQLVMNAFEKGIKAEGGLYMLVAQAVFAARHFTGKSYSEDSIDRIYNKLFGDKQNIVLIGMPGSGKTTNGKELAKKLGREFVDTDELIVQSYGDIPAIFEKQGESGFRKIEKEIIGKLSGQSSLVIATGGGAVLDSDNVFRLKQNGRLVFVDRKIEDIPATADRPLSNDRQKLASLYNTRLPIYKAVADVTVVMQEDIQQNVGNIINECFNK